MRDLLWKISNWGGDFCDALQYKVTFYIKQTSHRFHYKCGEFLVIQRVECPICNENLSGIVQDKLLELQPVHN